MKERYRRLKEIVGEELSCSAHNMEHVMRVYNLSLHLAKSVAGIDLDVLKSAVLLHDIGRIKEDKDDSGSINHAVRGAEMAGKILKDFDYPEQKIARIKDCIRSHRFRSGSEPRTKEAKILFDADKLDVIGSIGIARCFMIAGQYGERIYSDIPLDEYIEDNLVGGKPQGRIKDMSKHAPNLEFETKFKHIPDRLHLPKAKELAEKRIEFMERFFERLRREMKGEL